MDINTLLTKLIELNPNLVLPDISSDNKISLARNQLKRFNDVLKFYSFNMLINFKDLYKVEKWSKKLDINGNQSKYMEDINCKLTINNNKLEDIIIKNSNITFVIYISPTKIDNDIYYIIYYSEQDYLKKYVNRSMDNRMTEYCTEIMLKEDHIKTIDPEFVKIFGEKIYEAIPDAKYPNMITFNEPLYDKWKEDKGYFEAMFSYYDNKKLS